ncbi:MAG: hypothetical protein GY927_07380 [bacterium]|nr:hypothetical protein [bacterium]
MGLVQAKIESNIETSPQLIESLHMAREVALKSDVAEVLPAHLVLAMLEDDESSFLLDAYGVDFNKIRMQLGKIVRKQSKPKSPDRHAVFSAGIEAIMQHAREQAQKNALAEVDSNLILAIILSEKAGFMDGLLASYDLDTSGVLQYLELREGKTVNIDSLPSQQNPTSHPAKKAQRPGPGPQRKPAPASAPVTPTPAPARTSRPAASNQAAGTPAPTPQPAPHPPQDQPTAMRPDAPIEKAPAPFPNAAPVTPVTPVTPVPAMPTVSRHNKARSQPTPPEQGLSNLSPQLREMSSPVSGATPAALAAPAPSSGAPSRLRSLFGNMHKKLKDVARKSEKIPSAPTPSPPAPAPRPGTLTPTPANNNQSPPAASATSNQPAPPPQPMRPNPVSVSLEQLVDPANAAHINAPNTPPPPAPLNQHNRHAKRHRAAPSSLGSDESLSATGSVLEKGRLVEAVPRKMKMNKPSRAEVRITRDQLDEINSEFEDLSSSHIHELAVTEAMTVQLRAPGSGFHIENLSPQTQWIDRNQRHINDADFGVWRWNVTPIKSGKARLQLVISARTVDDDGNIHIADIPDKIIELSIAKDYGNGLRKLALITFLMISSLALGRYGEAAWQWAFSFISRLGS